MNKKWFYVIRPDGTWDTCLPSRVEANRHAKQIGGTVKSAEEYERRLKNGSQRQGD